MLSLADSKLKASFTSIAPSFIRNVCIIAHVDHGKTTLADYLISSNGIISARLAGKLRYMDSRDDEQTRGITMKSSAISLFYDPILVNLIDSPGHIDFCSEVNSAINLADVAILVVDVVEGVCSQTEALLREAVIRQLDIILVINKLDRLPVEWKMSCAEAHLHIQRLIEHINSCLSQILQAQYIEEENWHRLEEAENQLQFDPVKGNLLFASAYNGYAFALSDFASVWSKRIGIAKKDIEPYMFSFDHYFNGATKQILPGAESKGKRCLFEQFVFEPLWELHKCAFIDKDLERLKVMAAKLGLSDCKRRCRVDEAFGEFMREWMPLTDSVIRALCLFGRSPAKTFDKGAQNTNDLLLKVCNGSLENPFVSHLEECSADDKICIVHAAKFFCLNEKKVALCRIMCGTVREGDEFIATDSNLRAKDETTQLEIVRVRIASVYIVIGKELIAVDSAPAGQICALEAEEGKWIGGHSLISANYFENFKNVEDNESKLKEQLKEVNLSFESTHYVEPLVRVTIYPASGSADEINELRVALKQLAILDGAVRLFEQENGDLALVTAGEIHLQKCLKDLNDLGQTNITVSEPIVPFLETIIPDLQLSIAKIVTQHETECYLKQFNVRIRLRAAPLPNEIVDYLQKNYIIIDQLREGRFIEDLSKFQQQLLELAKTHLPKLKGSWWAKKSEFEIAEIFEQIWSFGSTMARPNILFNTIRGHNESFRLESNLSKKSRPLDRAIVSGFLLAMNQGPLCDEPMHGVCIILEEWTMGDDKTETSEALAQKQFDAQLQGQLISAFRQTCRAALKKHPLRLVAAMYKCCVQTSTQALGKVQMVLSQKHAKVVNENVNEMSGLFEVIAHMPVVESFSFCDQLRKRTSGLASAQLEFSHWQLIEEDPNWEPTTIDEVEEYGTNKNAIINQAHQYMDVVKKRKGLLTDEVIVVNAEKQRNLKRNK